MKKLFVVGIIAILLTSMFVGLVPSSVASPDDWVISDDTVEREDANVYMGATPHIITSGRHVYFDFVPKTYTGEADFVWGFDVPNVKPTKAELYHPHWNNWTTNHEQFFYNVSSFSPSSDTCDFGNSYNSLHYNVTYETCDNWNETTFECEGYKTLSSIVCFDSQVNDGTNYTAYWHTNHSKLILWNDISSSFTKKDYNHGGMNTWYYVKNVPVVAGESYQVRAWVDVPITIEGVNGKYWWAVKPSSETISQAIASGHFYALDPWYSSSWSHRKQWTITNVNATTLTNYPAYINVTDEAEMQADWDDVVFTDSNSNLIPYELENYTGSYGDYWVNISSLSGSGTYTGWMYYGNDAATSQENPEGVYDSYTKMVQHLQEAPANDAAGHLDSTSNNNDGTPKNFDGTATSTTDATGKIDGADIFDGANDYVDCGNDASLNITDAITIEMWVNQTADVDNGIAHRDKTGDKGWYFLKIGSTNSLRFLVSGDGTNVAYLTTDYTFTDTNWHHLVAVFAPGTLKIYVDSVNRIGSITGTVPNSLNVADTNLDVGRAKTFYLTGIIDEARIYNRALSVDEINQSYQLVTNQSTFVSWGGAEESWVNAPINLVETHDNFWVNWTWGPNNTGDALHTDSFNTSYWINTNHYWDNSTNTSRNETVGAHGWLNISVQAYNASAGKLSSAIGDNQQIPNNAPVITNTSDWQGDEGELVYLDFDYTDADGDTCTFSTNATEGSLNTTTGVFEWETIMSSHGTYFWNFTISDSYGGEDFYVANITVNGLYPPDIIDWWNNYTSNNLTHFTIAVGDNRTVFFNVTSNQSGMTWHWYKDVDLMQSSSSNNYTATWDVGGIDKEIRVYGSNPNGNTESLYWIIYIEYTAHEIEWLKYLEMQAQTEAEEMLGLSILLVILIVVALVLFLLGILVPHSVLTLLGSMVFFVTMVLPIPVLSNYPYFGIALTSILLLFGLIGIIITFYQFFTTYNSEKGYHKWDDYFDKQ